MSDNRQSLSDLAALTGATPPAPAPEPVTSEASASEGTETEAPAAPVNVQPEAPLREQQLDKQGRAYATGRRKDAIARVWLKPGSGKITVNGRDQATISRVRRCALSSASRSGSPTAPASMTLSQRSRAADCPARPARCFTASPRR
jgi:hypothetical protein